MARHGYVVMEWDEENREWFNIPHCDTLGELRERLFRHMKGICTSCLFRIFMNLPKKKFA